MKKNYTSPAIETTEVMVEAGIAMSQITLMEDNGFGIGGYDDEVTVSW